MKNHLALILVSALTASTVQAANLPINMRDLLALTGSYKKISGTGNCSDMMEIAPVQRLMNYVHGCSSEPGCYSYVDTGSHILDSSDGQWSAWRDLTAGSGHDFRARDLSAMTTEGYAVFRTQLQDLTLGFFPLDQKHTDSAFYKKTDDRLHYYSAGSEGSNIKWENNCLYQKVGDAKVKVVN